MRALLDEWGLDALLQSLEAEVIRRALEESPQENYITAFLRDLQKARVNYAKRYAR